MFISEEKYVEDSIVPLTLRLCNHEDILILGEVIFV